MACFIMVPVGTSSWFPNTQAIHTDTIQSNVVRFIYSHVRKQVSKIYRCVQRQQNAKSGAHVGKCLGR